MMCIRILCRYFAIDMSVNIDIQIPIIELNVESQLEKSPVRNMKNHIHFRIKLPRCTALPCCGTAPRLCLGDSSQAQAPRQSFEVGIPDNNLKTEQIQCKSCSGSELAQSGCSPSLPVKPVLEVPIRDKSGTNLREAITVHSWPVAWFCCFSLAFPSLAARVHAATRQSRHSATDIVKPSSMKSERLPQNITLNFPVTKLR